VYEYYLLSDNGTHSGAYKPKGRQYYFNNWTVLSPSHMVK